MLTVAVVVLRVLWILGSTVFGLGFPFHLLLLVPLGALIFKFVTSGSKRQTDSDW